MTPAAKIAADIVTIMSGTTVANEERYASKLMQLITGALERAHAEAFAECHAIAQDHARSLTGTGQGMAADIAEEIWARSFEAAPSKETK